MQTSNPSLLLIVDGHAYAYRAFHAIRELSAPGGAPTNAIYGFIKMLGKMRTQLDPTHLVVVWDGGLAAERLAELPEYKSQRPPMPAGLGQQIDDLENYLRAAGIVSLCRAGVEADDWIAVLARHAAARAWRVVIASSDKDFMQLVSPRIGLLNPNDKSEKIWTDADVRAKTGVAPEQIVDWLSLVGDSVDNIAGVPGVGPKTAADLLARFGTVETLLTRLPEVKADKLRGALAASAEIVRRNQRLVRLPDAAPEPVALEDLAVKPGAPAQLAPLYAQWGFRTLLASVSPAAAQQADLL